MSAGNLASLSGISAALYITNPQATPNAPTTVCKLVEFNFVLLSSSPINIRSSTPVGLLYVPPQTRKQRGPALPPTTCGDVVYKLTPVHLTIGLSQIKLVSFIK